MQCKDTEPLGRLVYSTAQDLRNTGEKILKPYDITLEQMFLMKNLYSADGVTQRCIGEIVSKTPANTTRILDRLEAKELIQRKNSPHDRRAMLIYLTPKGEKLFEKIRKILESFTEDTYQGVTEEELVITRRVFGKIQANIVNINNKLEEK